MEAEIWQAGIQALVAVPERVEPAVISREDWLEEARLYRGESGSAETPVLSAALLTAAARAAELAGETAEAVRSYDEALTRAPTAEDALRARARLAESVGDLDEAHALWARLAVSAGSAEERAFYGALSAEWTLGRRGSLPALAVDAIAAGPARALAVAEEALRGGAPGAAAAAFASAGRALGGGMGAAFLEQAARFSVVARDEPAAAAYRTGAHKLEPAAEESPLARLREAARADTQGVAARVGALLASLPMGSALAQAAGRWAAALARQRGDAAGALGLLAGLGATTAAAARDRIDLEVATQVGLDEASLARLRASASAPAASANLTWIEAGELIHRGEHDAAATLLARAIDEHADAVPLALLAEEIAAATDDGALRAATLDLWLRGDSARRADAALALAATRDAAGSGLGARAALQTAVESAPESAAFWIAAAADARAGRRSDAAAALGYGAEVWEASALAPGLRGAAAAKYGPSDPARVLAALGPSDAGAPSDAAHALGEIAVARLAERAGDRAALETALDAAGAAVADPAQRAWLALRRAAAIPPAEAEARARAFEATLEVSSAHPLALALYLCEPGVEPGAAAAAMTQAGSASGESSGWSRLLALAAATTLSLTGDREGALSRALAILGAAPAAAEARRAVARAAAAIGGDAGTRTLAALAVEPAARDEALSLAIAEARLAVALRRRRRTSAGRARRRTIRGGSAALGGAIESRPRRRGCHPGFSPDRPTDQPPTRGPPWRRSRTRRPLGAGTISPPRSPAPRRMRRCRRRSRWRWPRSSPKATAARRRPTGWLKRRFGRRAIGGPGRRRPRCRPWRASPTAPPIRRLGCAPSPWWRRASAPPNPIADLRRRRWRSGRGSRRRPPSLAPPSRAGVRRLLPSRPSSPPPGRFASPQPAAGDAAAASAACETEAACLLVPTHRVRALLLAAALAVEAAPPERGRALGLLRSALAIEPTQEAAFERLRALLTDEDDVPALAAALAARIEVAQNPFEITSLRLARADLLAGRLADWAAARERAGGGAAQTARARARARTPVGAPVEPRGLERGWRGLSAARRGRARSGHAARHLPSPR